MRVFRFRRRSGLYAAALGAVAVLLQWLAMPYWALDKIDRADLSRLSGRIVAIDAGHGGIDSGAGHNGAVEKEINLAIALKLGAILEAHGAKVMYTRREDTDYYTRGKGGKRNDLLKRAEMVKTSGAAVFISLHCNAIREKNWRGAQVFYNDKRGENKLLAELIQEALKDCPPHNRRQAKRDAKILLLNAIDVPGVIIESGFLSNPEEAGLLTQSGYQQQLAGQIAKALAVYFSEMQVGGRSFRRTDDEA